MANSLHAAKVAKNDEFYTRLEDIEKELRFYKDHFQGKVVFCNCDDPYESNFFKYFALHFNDLGLKKLICTCYDGSPFMGDELIFDFDIFHNEASKKAYKVEITEVKDENGDGAIDLSDVRILLQNNKNAISLLKGNGDFRSAESIELLKEADIVVTNPPFSLFREYMAQLIEYQKSFVILGNPNAITYREIFSLIKKGFCWIGQKSMGSDMYFRVSKEYAKILLESKKEGSGYVIIDNEIMGRAAAIWFTNLDIQKRHENMDLYKNYTPEEYPTYDNYDAINVDKVTDIPCDYEGVMGVPITFLDKYNPDQFEIIGQGQGCLYRELASYGLKQEFVDNYYQHGGKGAIKADHPVLGYYNAEGIATIPYMRILIRKRRK